MATSSVLANSSKSKPGVTTGNVNINRSNSNGNLTQQNQNFQRQSQTENQNHTHGSIINGFKIAHININHLIHKKNFINELISKNNISIFAVTETWLSGDISDGEISIPHYRVFRRDRTDRRGGGVCIYIHETINFKVLVHQQDPSLEVLWLTLCEATARSTKLRKMQFYKSVFYQKKEALLLFTTSPCLKVFASLITKNKSKSSWHTEKFAKNRLKEKSSGRMRTKRQNRKVCSSLRSISSSPSH